MLQDNVADFMFRVHDTGIGMDHAFLNRIFRPFEQESIETGRKFGGTGLGMTITDQLVRLMGGEIVVDSAPGKARISPCSCICRWRSRPPRGRKRRTRR